MKRRQFIGLSAYIAAAIALPFAESCSTGNNDIAVSEPALLLRILNTKSIIETGHAYLQQYPAENSKEILRDLLLDKNLRGTTTGAKAIHSWLMGKTVEDFQGGQTVIVNGWVFARTEARQCGLYALLQS